MSTRRLKFSGSIGTVDPEGSILINDQLVYSGVLGAGLSTTPLERQDAAPGELVVISWEGVDEEEIVEVTVNIASGVVRLGPIFAECQDFGELSWRTAHPTDLSDGRTNVAINGSAPVEDPDFDGIPQNGDSVPWNGWCFSLSGNDTFTCNYRILPKIFEELLPKQGINPPV